MRRTNRLIPALRQTYCPKMLAVTPDTVSVNRCHLVQLLCVYVRFSSYTDHGAVRCKYVIALLYFCNGFPAIRRGNRSVQSQSVTRRHVDYQTFEGSVRYTVESVRHFSVMGPEYRLGPYVLGEGQEVRFCLFLRL